MMNLIQGSSWLIQAICEQVCRQTFIIIFKQLTAYKNLDFQWMFGACYEQWQNWAGEGFELTLNQHLTKANSEYTHLVHLNQWKTKEDLQIIALTVEVKGLHAMVAKFNCNHLNQNLKLLKPWGNLLQLQLQSCPTRPCIGSRLLPNLEMRRNHKRTSLAKHDGGVRHATFRTSCTWWTNTKPKIQLWTYLGQASIKWWGIFSKAFVLPVPSHPADCHAL